MEGIKFITVCTGGNDKCICDMAMNAVDTKQLPILVKYITRIIGKPFKIIKYRDVSKWSSIKSYFFRGV